MLLTSSLFLDLCTFIVSLVVIFISFYKWQFSYWKRRNLQYIEPSIPWGNITNPGKKSNGVSLSQIYKEMKNRNWRHGGMYILANPNYMVVDPDLVKCVLTKDFQYFSDRGMYYNEEDDPTGAHLKALRGVKWRNLRSKLTPTFTTGKIKMMFQTLLNCQRNLQEQVDNAKGNPIDIKDILGCFTIDVIVSCAFGLDCSSSKDKDSPFRKYGRKIFQPGSLERLRTIFTINFPRFAKVMRMRQTSKDVADFFKKVITETVHHREEQNVFRNDFMQLLLGLKNKQLLEDDCGSLTIEEIVAQCYIFFLAGFETSSTTMTFALYELAKNQQIQDKVRDEIYSTLKKHQGEMTYETIQDMTYLQKVLDETLRKYPPLPFISRKCVKNYRVPGENTVIEKNTMALISVLGIHHDEEYYPNPDTFNPDRFNEERKPYTYLPFGEGPRNCIGLRFGLMQSKVGIAALLRKFKFTLNEKTHDKMTFQVDSFILAVEGDVWLNAEQLPEP